MRHTSWAAILVSILGSLLLASCWLVPFTREVESLETSAPGSARFGEDASSALPDGSLAAAAGPQNLPTPSLRGTDQVPVPMIGLLPGGLRAAAARLADTETATDQPAHVQITLRHRNVTGNRLVAAHVLARLATETPVGENDPQSLRDLVQRRGGELTVEVGLATTRIRMRVPGRQFRQVLQQCALALGALPGSTEGALEVRDRVIRELTEQLSADPLTAIVDRVREFELLGVSQWLSEGEDLSLTDLRQLHEQIYSSNGSIIALHVPGLPAIAVLRAATLALEAWTRPHLGQPPEQIEVARPAHGCYWAHTEGGVQGAVVIDLPSALAADAAVEQAAIECLTADGAGGRLGEQLTRRLDLPLRLRPTLVDDGLRLRLELGFRAGVQQLPQLRNGLRSAWRSLAADPPGVDELRNAAQRARLQLLRRWTDPDWWLRSATHLTAAGARPDVMFPPEGEVDVPTDGPPAWQRVLAELGDPDRLGNAAGFGRFDDGFATLVAVGGGAADDTLTDGFSAVPDVLVPDVRRSTVAADLTEQRRIASELLSRSIDAVGGPQRLLAMRGFHGVAITASGRGPELVDELWFDATDTSRLHRIRRVLATRIETRIDGAQGTEESGKESVELTPGEVRRNIESAGLHPLLLLRRIVTGEDRYRAISVRHVEDRDHAILVREDDPTLRLRLHVDSGSGLIRVVTCQSTQDGEPLLVRIDQRDYRRCDSGLRAPHWQIVNRGDGPQGLTTSWRSFTTTLPEWPTEATSDTEK